MSYQPFNRNVSGIVFFGQNGSDPVYVSDTNFVINSGAGTEHLYSSNIRVADGGNIGSVTDPDSIAIASNGDVTFSQSVSVTNNLTVNGTLTTINTATLVVNDPLIMLASGNAADVSDVGFFGQYVSGVPDNFAGLFRDATDNKFRLFDSLEERPTTTVNLGGAGYNVSTLVANIEGDVTGNLTGTASSATALATSRNFSVDGTNESTSNTVGFDGTANVVLNWTAQSGIITNRAELAVAPDATNDYILIYDDDAGVLKRINRSNFVSGLGGMSNFIVTDSGGVVNTVDDGETVEFQDGVSVSFTVSPNGSDFFVSGYIPDGGVTETQLNTSVAGNGLTGGGGTVLAVGAGSLIDVTANAVDVDLTEAAAATIADGDYLIFLDGGTAGAESKGDTSDLATLLGGNGLTVTNSTLSVSAGVGLVLNGNNVDLDFSELSPQQMASGDTFAMLDSNGLSEQLGTLPDLGAYLAGAPNSNLTVNGSGQLIAAGNFSSFDIAGDTGTETVDDGEQITFAGSTGLDVDVTATNTVTYTIDMSEYTSQPIGVGDSFMMLDNDGTTEQRSTVTALGTYMAGTNITNTAGVLSVTDADISTVVFQNNNFIDSSSIAFSADGDTVTAIVPNSGVVESMRYRTTEAVSTTKTLSSDINLCNAAGGALIVTLPENGGTIGEGRMMVVKKTDSSSNTVSVARQIADTIDGGTIKVLYNQYETMSFVTDGSNWFII